MSYTDKYGVKYSDDGKTLEYCPKDFKGKYEIPYGVTTIGVPSFLRYDLDNLDKWNDDAFANCHGLTEIVIPNSVIEINREAFSNCTSLKEIRIPDCTFVEEKAFEGCSNINKIYCSQMSEVFLELPSVKEIHTSNLTMQITKKNWYLKEIFLSDDYYPTWNFRAGNFVEEFLFRNGFGKMNCQSLDKIEVPPMNTQLDSRGGCNAVIETSTNTLLFGCNHTIIPDTVTTISAYAFLDSKKLKTIHVPESVTTIGDYAFKGCYNLCEIQLPESILAIGENAFPHGKALKRIVVPKGKRKHFLKIGLKNYADLVVEE